MQVCPELTDLPACTCTIDVLISLSYVCVRYFRAQHNEYPTHMLFQDKGTPPCLACMDALGWGEEITFNYRLVQYRST